MNTKNIFYTSSAQSQIFPQNSRSDFKSLIDEQKFYHLNKNKIEAAVKNITFENKFKTFYSENLQPDIIIVQDYGLNVKPHYKYEGKWNSGKIDIKSGKDYYLFEDGAFGEGKNFTTRNFTDVKLLCKTINNPSLNHGFLARHLKHGFLEDLTFITIHNIYFHDVVVESVKELVSYLNNIYSNLEFDLTKIKDKSKLFRIHAREHILFYDKRSYGLDILLSKNLCDILGFDKEDMKEYSFPNLRKQVQAILLEKEDKQLLEPFYTLADLEQFTKNSYSNAILDSFFPTNNSYLRIFEENLLGIKNSVRSGSKVNLEINKPDILGFKTTLSKPDIYKNGVYDTQIEFINVKDHPQGVQIHDVKNPIFFHTSLEKIANPTFKFIDVQTGKPPNFALGVPTQIQLLTKTSTQMSSSFNLFLDSSDEVSFNYFPANHPFDFTIKLPERLEFGKHWEMTLKNLFIGNDFFNVFQDSCRINVVRWRTNGQFLDLSGRTTINNDDLILENTTIELADARFRDIEQLCYHIERKLSDNGFGIKVFVRSNRVHFRSVEQKSISINEKLFFLRKFELKISPYLSNILGIERTLYNESKISLDKDFTAVYKPNISLLAPVIFFIHCDVVSETIYGTETIKLLRMITSNFDKEDKIKTFSFYQDEFVDLAVKEFSTIKIQITDNTGNLIKSTRSYPTRCQIQFVKKK